MTGSRWVPGWMPTHFDLIWLDKRFKSGETMLQAIIFSNINRWHSCNLYSEADVCVAMAIRCFYRFCIANNRLEFFVEWWPWCTGFWGIFNKISVFSFWYSTKSRNFFIRNFYHKYRTTELETESWRKHCSMEIWNSDLRVKRFITILVECENWELCKSRFELEHFYFLKNFWDCLFIRRV